MAQKGKSGASGDQDNSRSFELLTIAVASGQSVRDACKEIGVSESHAYHLSASQTFKERVAEIRKEVACAAVGKLTDASTKAVDTLTEMLDSAFEPSVRLNAAKAILANLGPLSELAELRARLDEIEKERKPRLAAHG